MTYVTESGAETTVFTYFSHRAGGKDVSAGEIGSMARQCRITTKQFRALVECTLSRTEYEEILVRKEAIPPTQTRHDG